MVTGCEKYRQFMLKYIYIFLHISAYLSTLMFCATRLVFRLGSTLWKNNNLWTPAKPSTALILPNPKGTPINITLNQATNQSQQPQKRKDLSLPGLPLAQVIAMYSRDRGVEDGKLVQGPVVTFNILSAEGRPTKIDFWDLWSFKSCHFSVLQLFQTFSRPISWMNSTCPIFLGGRVGGWNLTSTDAMLHWGILISHIDVMADAAKAGFRLRRSWDKGLERPILLATTHSSSIFGTSEMTEMKTPRLGCQESLGPNSSFIQRFSTSLFFLGLDTDEVLPSIPSSRLGSTWELGCTATLERPVASWAYRLKPSPSWPRSLSCAELLSYVYNVDI